MIPDQTTRVAMLQRGAAFCKARRELTEFHDGVESVIMAVIAEGATTRDGIIGTVARMSGFRHAHVARTLDDGTGDDASTCAWYRDALKNYHLHTFTPVKRKRKPKVSRIGQAETF